MVNPRSARTEFPLFFFFGVIIKLKTLDHWGGQRAGSAVLEWSGNTWCRYCI